MLQARRAQAPSAFEMEIGTLPRDWQVKIIYLFHLAFAQRLVGDMAGAKVTAEQARNTMGGKRTRMISILRYNSLWLMPRSGRETWP